MTSVFDSQLIAQAMKGRGLIVSIDCITTGYNQFNFHLKFGPWTRFASLTTAASPRKEADPGCFGFNFFARTESPHSGVTSAQGGQDPALRSNFCGFVGFGYALPLHGEMTVVGAHR